MSVPGSMRVVSLRRFGWGGFQHTIDFVERLAIGRQQVCYEQMSLQLLQNARLVRGALVHGAALYAVLEAMLWGNKSCEGRR